MKKIFSIFCSVFFSLSIFLTFGCNSDSGGSGEEAITLNPAPETIEEGYIRVNYKGSGNWTLWIWKDFDETETAKNGNWPNGVPVMYQNGEDFICWDLKLAENPSVLGMIVVNSAQVKGSGEADLFFYFPKRYNEIFITNEGKIFVDSALTKEAIGLSSATITKEDEITLTCAGITLSAETVTLTDKNGATVSVASYDSKIKLSSSIKASYFDIQPLTLSVKISDTETDSVQVGLASDLVESWVGNLATENATDLGLSLNGTNASFKMWAPLASKVSLVLFKDAEAVSEGTVKDEQLRPLTSETNGYWTLSNVDVSGYRYYKYRIESGAESHDVADIWAKVGSVDSVATQIINIDDSECVPASWESSYTNPFGKTGTEAKSYTDAVIYEMHIRDWSKAIGKDGKFINLAESSEFINHLKDIGITHIQILPSFDYAQLNSDPEYNWGYNPYNYNVPEGRYVQDMKDGSDAVKQFRQFIKAVHDAGIAVNMDVVYNHTNGTLTGSIYDMTVPQYFYRVDASGNYYNGSGCGNEVATNHVMVKKFVIESLKHWMNDYHINGFRFDLMGLHETTTMRDIYTELSKIDSNVMVYGEPWTGRTSGVISGVQKSNIDACFSSTTQNGVACFNDDFRNAIKGAEFGGFKQGHVQGTFYDDEINVGLMGSLRGARSNNKIGFTNVLGRSLNYVECHDNYTLFDKLAISYLKKESYSGDLFKAIGSGGLNAVKAQDKLAAAYVFLAQGTPFINGGQEFLRTKQGDENSYKSDDSINAINLSFKTTYSDVYNTYKGLIALRKANPSAFGNNKDATAETISEGVTKYTTGDYLVYFNATGSATNINTSGYTKLVDVTSGSVVESTSLPTKAEAKSFVILKK